MSSNFIPPRPVSLAHTAEVIDPTSEHQQNIDPSPSVTNEQKEVEIRLKFAEEEHQYIREYIRLADQKAGFFFAAAAALVAYLNKVGYLTGWLNCSKELPLIDFFSFLASLTLFVSLINCLLVIAPRLAGNLKGLIFFHGVSNFNHSRDYSDAVRQSSLEEILEQKLMHAYELAKVCKRKYHSLLWAIWAGALGLVFTILLLFIAKA